MPIFTPVPPPIPRKRSCSSAFGSEFGSEMGSAMGSVSESDFDLVLSDDSNTTAELNVFDLYYKEKALIEHEFQLIRNSVNKIKEIKYDGIIPWNDTELSDHDLNDILTRSQFK